MQQSNEGHAYLVGFLLLTLGYQTLNTASVEGIFFLLIFALVYFLGITLKRSWLRWLGVGMVLFLILFYNFGIALDARHVNPADVHDGILQIEAANTFLLQGMNPYAADYTPSLGTANRIFVMGQSLPNPAATHLVSLPFHFLFGLPFQFILQTYYHWFDFRVVQWGIGIITAIVIARLRHIDEWKRQLWIILFLLNFLFFPFFIEGRNDVFVFSLIVGSCIALAHKHYARSVIFFALACVSKESAWFLFPFYSAYWYGLWQNKAISSRQIKKYFGTFIAIFCLFMLPFFVWSPTHFIDDIYRYPAGTAAVSYPINGFSVASMLYGIGLIRHITDSVSLWPLDILIVLPLLVTLLIRQLRHNSLTEMLGNYALFITVFWLCSRFFHDNYLGFVALLLLFAWLINEIEKSSVTTAISPFNLE